MHFDLKSANVLLGRDWTAKIADVGLAKILKDGWLSTLREVCSALSPPAMSGELCLLGMKWQRSLAAPLKAFHYF